MATLREKRPGVWEVRVFIGSDARGRPTQLSRTVHGGKRDAQRVAAELEVGPGRASPGGRCVGDVLDADDLDILKGADSAQRIEADFDQTARRAATRWRFSPPAPSIVHQQLLGRFLHKVVQNGQASQRTVPPSAVVEQALRLFVHWTTPKQSFCNLPD